MEEKRPLSRIVRGEFATLVKLNMLFVLACIPVVTAGPALLALFELTAKVLRDEPVALWPESRAAFCRRFRDGMVFVVCAAVFALLWRFAVRFYLSGLVAGPLAGAMLFGVLFAGWLTLAACLCFLALLGAGGLGAMRAVRGALLLTVAHPLRAFGAAAAVACAGTVLRAFAIHLLPALLFLGGSAAAVFTLWALQTPAQRFLSREAAPAAESEG